MWEENVVKYVEVNQLNFSKEGYDMLTHFEGVELESYQDSGGVWTIGYGHTGTAKPGQKITKNRALELLREDLRRFEKGVKSRVKVPVTQYQYDALVDFSFNLGLGALNRSTLLEKVNNLDYEGAAQEFNKWTYVAGNDCRKPENKCYGIVIRRQAETDLFKGKGFNK